MKVAIVGSRSLKNIDIEKYLPEGITEVVSGGAVGIDTLAKKYAEKHGLKYTEFRPEYDKYGKAAPIKRNDLIIDYADVVYAFYDGHSRGTQYVIERCRKLKKRVWTVLFVR